MGLEKSSIVEKAATNLADIWCLSATERDSIMADIPKIRLCVHISNMLLEQGLGPDAQAAWFRANFGKGKPLYGNAPLDLMMERGLKGIAYVDRYLASRRSPMLD